LGGVEGGRKEDAATTIAQMGENIFLVKGGEKTVQKKKGLDLFKGGREGGGKEREVQLPLTA